MKQLEAWTSGVALVLAAASLGGCASLAARLQDESSIGGLFESYSRPMQAVPGSRLGLKSGQAKVSAMHILMFGWMNDTNNGIEAARRSGGINRISHVDLKTDGLELGVFGYRTLTVTVYGD